AWKKLPQIALLLVLFFTSYFLVSNVIRIGTIFGERLFYWPSVFALIMIAWGIVSLYEFVRTILTQAVAQVAHDVPPAALDADLVLNYQPMPRQSRAPLLLWKGI